MDFFLGKLEFLFSQLVLFMFYFSFGTRACYVAQADEELLILTSPPPKSWKCRWSPASKSSCLTKRHICVETADRGSEVVDQISPRAEVERCPVPAGSGTTETLFNSLLLLKRGAEKKTALTIQCPRDWSPRSEKSYHLRCPSPLYKILSANECVLIQIYNEKQNLENCRTQRNPILKQTNKTKQWNPRILWICCFSRSKSCQELMTV